MKKALLWGIVLILILGVLWGSFLNTSGTYEKIGYALDTQIRIVVYDKKDYTLAVEEAYNEILRLDKLFSNFNEQSETYKLNKNKELAVSDELLSLIKLGMEITEATDGVYDLTVYPLTTLWDYKKENVPQKEEIKKAKAKIGISNIDIDGNKVILSNECEIDVSSIAKGYIADYIIDLLKSKGVKNALVDAGGNIKVLGNSPKNKDGFIIGIKSPFEEMGQTVGSITVKDKAVVTSGIYERNFEKDGKMYHHIIDISTGYPSDSDLVSATVISDNSAKADAYATALVIMGSKKAMEFIENNPHIEGILITKDKEILVSDDSINFKKN